VKKNSKRGKKNPPSSSSRKEVIPNSASGPFGRGTIVLATLNNPREKFWGSILGLDPAGLSLRGIELSSFEDCTNMVIAGDSFAAVALFFPMHRVERVELDLPEGDIPSLSQRFATRTGLDPALVLNATSAATARKSRGTGA
jgi:hypothetical protein